MDRACLIAAIGDPVRDCSSVPERQQRSQMARNYRVPVQLINLG